MSTGPDGVDVGEEITRLTEALAGWWAAATTRTSPPAPADQADQADQADHADHADHADDAPDAGPVPAADHSSQGSCGVCPVCRVLDLARGVGPDLLDQMATAAETVALLIRDASASRRPTPPADEPWSRGTPITVTDVREVEAPDDQPEGGRAWG